ncbi:MAG: acyltransferase domain-containing protein, partial [Bryobacteraceae bacterium]
MAGVLSLEEAVRVVVHRGRIMQAATGLGKMAVVHLPASAVAAEIATHAPDLAIAAINSPEQTVISGRSAGVDAMVESWSGRGIACRMMPVNYAFHSPQMEPFREELVRTLGRVATGENTVSLLSTVLARRMNASEMDAAYWGKNIRETVLFSDAIQAAGRMGVGTFIEVGPHPVLLPSIDQCPDARGANVESPRTLVPSLRRNCDGRPTLLASLGTLFVRGYPADWTKIYPQNAAPVSLPVYAYQRRRYWADKRPPQPVRGQLALTGTRIRSPLIRGHVFETHVSVQNLPYLADHRIGNHILFPLTGFLELVRAAASEACGSYGGVADLAISEPLEIGEDSEHTLQVAIEGEAFQVYSLDGEKWKEHVNGHLRDCGLPEPLSPRLRQGAPVAIETHYERLATRGLLFGPAFQTVRDLTVGDSEASARVSLRDQEAGDHARYGIHPALFDGCLQAAMAAAPADAEGVYLPFAVERLQMFGAATAEAVAHASIRPGTGNDTLTADIDVTGTGGEPVARITGLRLRRLAHVSGRDRKLYQIRWTARAREQRSAASPQSVLIVGGSSDSAAFANALEARGRTVCAGPENGLDAIVYLDVTDCERLLGDIQELLRRFPSKPPQVWLVTQAAVRVRPEDRCYGLFQFPGFGFMRSVALEHPELRPVRVDRDETDASMQALADEIVDWDGESDLAFRSGERYVSRLT